MAINPEELYPGRCDPSSPDYPFGAAKDESVEGAEDGFPLQAAWIRDIQGFFQGLLSRAGITPSGVEDTATASDYLDALIGNGTGKVIPLSALGDGLLEINLGTQYTLRIEARDTNPPAGEYNARIDIVNNLTGEYVRLISTGLTVADTTGAPCSVAVKKDRIVYDNAGSSGAIVTSSRAQFACPSSGWSGSPTNGFYTRTDDLTLTGIPYGCRIRSSYLSYKVADGTIHTAPITLVINDNAGTARITYMAAPTYNSPAIGSELVIDIEFDTSFTFV